jgi:hypothetical protein
MHRFTEHFQTATLTCISAGQLLVALGSKMGGSYSCYIIGSLFAYFF